MQAPPKNWAAALPPLPPAALAARADELCALVPRPGCGNARAVTPGGAAAPENHLCSGASTHHSSAQDPEGLFKQEPQAGIIEQRLYFKAAAADQDFETKMEGFKKHQQEELNKKREVSPARRQGVRCLLVAY